MKNIILLFTVLTLLFTAGCSGETSVKKLSAKQISEYEGQKLSSINDFRENSIKGPQYIDKDKYLLKVKGLVENPKSYTYHEIIDNYEKHKKLIQLDCVEGWSVKILWEGVLIEELIQEAGAKPEAKIVIFRSQDGYSTSFPLDYLLENDIIMAYKMNDIVIPPERGFPFQLVADGKWGYKWIKWITEIELSDDTTYRGYWEQRGYSNNGDLNKSFFEE